MEDEASEGRWTKTADASAEMWVQLSPKMLDRFGKLEEAVRGSTQFDSDMYQNLKELTLAEPMLVEHAVSHVAHMSRKLRGMRQQLLTQRQRMHSQMSWRPSPQPIPHAYSLQKR